MARKRYKKIYVVEITGNSKELIDQTLGEFFNSTVSTFYKLRDPRDELRVTIGSTFCSCPEGEPHMCIAKIKMERVDISE